MKTAKGKKAALFIMSGGVAATQGNTKEIMKNWMKQVEISVNDVFLGLQIKKEKLIPEKITLIRFLKKLYRHSPCVKNECS